MLARDRQGARGPAGRGAARRHARALDRSPKAALSGGPSFLEALSPVRTTAPGRCSPNFAPRTIAAAAMTAGTPMPLGAQDLTASGCKTHKGGDDEVRLFTRSLDADPRARLPGSIRNKLGPYPPSALVMTLQKPVAVRPTAVPSPSRSPARAPPPARTRPRCARHPALLTGCFDLLTSTAKTCSTNP